MRKVTEEIRSKRSQEDFPAEWAPQTSNCELIDIALSSDEAAKITARFQQTLSKIITRIQRVQNKVLYSQYAVRAKK